MKKPISRRRFLKEGSAVGAAVAVGCSDPAAPGDDTDAGTTPDSAAASDEGAPDTTDVPDEGRPARQTGVVVSVVRGKDLKETIRRAVEAAGGLLAIKEGQTVVLKPNAVHAFANDEQRAVVTPNDFLRAVIQLVRERKPGKIIVADRSARFFPSDAVFAETGMDVASLDAGADEVYPAPKPADDPDTWVLMQPKGWEETWAEDGGVQVMKVLLEADHIINLPVLKNHRYAAFSMALKNFIGGVGDDSRNRMHYDGRGMPARLSRDIAILNGAFKTTMNIVDARTALVNGGPEGVYEDAVRTTPGIILASRDRVAIDAFAVALLQHELASVEVPIKDEVHDRLMVTPVWQLPQLIEAVDLGIGVASADEVQLHFEAVDEADALETRFRGQ